MDVVVVTNRWTFMFSVRIRYEPRNVTWNSNINKGFLETTHDSLTRVTLV